MRSQRMISWYKWYFDSAECHVIQYVIRKYENIFNVGVCVSSWIWHKFLGRQKINGSSIRQRYKWKNETKKKYILMEIVVFTSILFAARYPIYYDAIMWIVYTIEGKGGKRITSEWNELGFWISVVMISTYFVSLLKGCTWMNITNFSLGKWLVACGSWLNWRQFKFDFSKLLLYVGL